MKRHILFLLACAIIYISACTKKSSTTPTPTPTPTNTSPYYFKFTFNGTTYDLNANDPQYMSFYTNVAGGYQVSDTSMYTSVGLSFTWPAGDTVKESDIMGLIGQTLSFNDTAITPALTFDQNLTATEWDSYDTSNTNYYIKITNVTFLKNDTTLGNPVRTYVITGTCSAIMEQTTTPSIFSGGQFNFIISRRNF